jgi:hypothetical protein
MLTDVAPVTFQNKIDALPELTADGLLLNSVITGGAAGHVTTGGIVFDVGAGTITQLGMRMSNSSSDNERKTNFFNLLTSKNMLPATSTHP